MEIVEERALIARVLEGDRLAARELYDAHAPRVYRVVLRITRDEALAEECTQDTFVKVFSRLTTFRGDSKVGTWIHRIAVTMALNALRTRQRRSSREVSLDGAEAMPAPSGSAEPDLKDRIRQAISALPDMYRIPVVLFDLEGYSHSEIATMIGVPEGTCKSRLMRARAQLREALAAHAP